jgi:hypothetical protein
LIVGLIVRTDRQTLKTFMVARAHGVRTRMGKAGLLDLFFQEGSGRNVRRKIKGCDIGYALAARSREGADSVDACTVTAF